MVDQHMAPSRYHALDSLQAAMMFLGIYLHAVVAYSPHGGWPFKPPQVTTTLDPTMVWIHAFRMPAFYVMAGFFAALLYERYGLRRAAENRFWRIVVPFVVGWIIVFPLVMFMVILSRADLDAAVEFILSGRFLAHAHPLHLWFLEYLIVLYLLAIACLVIVRRLSSQDVRAFLLLLFRAIVRSPWVPLPFAAATFLTLLPMQHGSLDDPPSFVPATRIVAAYAIPFFFGWLLYLNADLLEVLRRRAWLYSIAAAVTSVAYVATIYSIVDRGMAFYAVRGLLALAMWCLILGVTGLFLRCFGGHSPLRRYLCDSSYFLYIAHLPVIMAFQLILLNVALPPLAKIAVVLIATVAVLLPLYHFGIRPTFVGAVLNGRRYPIGRGAAVAVAG